MAPAAAQKAPAPQAAPEKDPFADIPFDLELDKKKQDEIWLGEHVTFELEARFGKRFVAAWKARDEEQFRAMLLPGFLANAAPEFRRELAHEFVSQRSGVADEDRQPVDAAAWTAQLFAASREFARFAWTTIRVLQIERKPEQPHRWMTRILLGAAGEDAAGQLIEFSSEHAVVFEIPEDATQADQVPVIESWSPIRQNFLTAKHSMFREVTHEYGLDEIGVDDNWKLPVEKVVQYRFQMAVDDFDRDGWLDLAIAEKNRSRLLRWSPEKQRFEDVTSAIGVIPMHILFGNPVDLAGWIDYDNDGYPDLLLGNRLYHNDAGRHFTDVTSKSGLTMRIQGMGVQIADYDADGLLDIYILYQANHETKRPERLRWIAEVRHGEKNQLWRNLGNGQFEDVTERANAGAGLRQHFAGAWFHYDDDQYPDIYTANDFSPNVLLRNLGNGTFEDVSDSSGGTAYATSMGVAAGDTDNNGTSDLYIANMFSKMGRRIISHVCADDYPAGVFEQVKGSCSGNQLYRRQAGDLRYNDVGEQMAVHGVGWAYAPALADFDNDGWLDIYATTGFLSFERGKPDG
ncbi:MAG: VCBS repeat-containing protein [Planctomycetia bacterium]|nr:VCBS repeat-containing protein [Planctomycetia bacterium]